MIFSCRCRPTCHSKRRTCSGACRFCTTSVTEETILLVEDEEILRELVKEILQQSDYQVVEAANGVEALKVWEEHNGEFDLLLTDMLMPEGMTGGDLAKQLRVRQPELKVIYTSGYSAEIMGENSDLRDSPFLAKPYSGAQLTRLVRDCLDARVGAESMKNLVHSEG